MPSDTDKQRLDSLRAMIKGLVQMKAESDEVIDRLRRELERHERDYAPREPPKKRARPR